MINIVIMQDHLHTFCLQLHVRLVFPRGSAVRNPPAMQETQVPSLGAEDPLEKEMATHSNFLAWRISWTGEPGRLQSMGLQRIGHN